MTLETVGGRELVKPRHELTNGDSTKRELHGRPHVDDVGPDPYALIAHDDDPAAPCVVHPDANWLTVQRNRIACAPLDRRMALGHAQALGGDPFLMAQQERLRVASRPAPGNGHAQRAVGPDLKDVLTRTPDADEDDVRLRRRVRGTKEWEIELHPVRILPGGFRVPGSGVPGSVQG